MSLKKLGVALLAVFVMGAIVANGACAETQYSEPGGQWYTGESPGTKLPVGGAIGLSVSGGSSFLTSKIAGSAIKFSSTGVSTSSCSAINPTTTSATLDCVNLVFSGVTVGGEAATGCTTPPTIVTKELTGVLGMNKAGTLATIKITPKGGVTFATVELTGTCANAGLYKVTGTVFAQTTSATGVFGFFQGMSVSEAIQKEAGTTTSLKFGENGAFLNASVTATAAVRWGGKEK